MLLSSLAALAESPIALEQILETLGAIALHLHQFNTLDATLDYGVRQIRELFGADRVLVYQFLPSGDGVVIAEAVGEAWQPIIGQLICDPCFQKQWAEQYRQGRIKAIHNVQESGLDSCHIRLLTRIQVKANLVVPILVRVSNASVGVDPDLWGLLIVQQCSAPRIWQSLHGQILKQIADQIGIAIRHLQVQARLEQSQAREIRWQAAFEGTEDGVWDWNIATGEVFFSPTWKTMLGYTDPDLENSFQTWSDRIHPADRDAVFAELAQHFTGQAPIYRSEHRLLTQSGQWKWVLDRGKVIEWSSAGEPLRMVGTHVDITDRKATEIALHQSQKQWHMLFHSLDDFLIIADTEGRILTVNSVVEERLGYSRTELLTMSALDLHPPDQRQRAAEILVDMIAGTRNLCTIPLITQDGRCIPVETKVRLGVWQNRPALLGISRDISDRQAAESALHEREAFLRSIYNGCDVSIFVVDVLPDGNFHYAGLNPAHEQLTGISNWDLQGKTPDQLFPPDAAALVQSHYTDCVQVGRSIAYEECLPFQGEETWWLTKLTPLRNEDGQIVRLIGTSLNVSDRKRMEEALRESQEKYHTLFQILPVGVSITSADGHLVEVNSASERILDLSVDQHLQRQVDASDWNIIRPDGSPMPAHEFASVRALQENRLVQNVEMGIVHADGTVRWIMVSAAPIPLEHYGVAIAYMDITDIKQAKDLLLLQSAALDASANVIVITDRRGTIEWANPAFTQLTGYTLEEAIGKNPRDLVKSNRQDIHFYAHLWRTITHGEVWQGKLFNRRKDGSIYPEDMTITPVQDEQGEIHHFIAIKQDITERYRLEQHLQERDEMLRKISEQVPGVVYQYRLYPDGQSCFPYASEAIRQIYEVTPKQVQQDAQDVLARLHPDDFDRVVDLIWQSFHRLELWHDEYRVLLPERGLRWLEGHAMPERLADGSVLWHGYIWDITDRKSTETLLQQEVHRERMVHLINHHIRASLDLETILHTTVQEVRQFLNTDRVIIYRFQADWSGLVVAESVAPGWLGILDQEITDTYFVTTRGITYHDNHLDLVPDIYTAGFSACHIDLMEWLQVRAKLVVPILQTESLGEAQRHHLWGLLIAHHCQGARDWQLSEGRLLQQLASQLAIAIQQSELHHQLQILNTNLDQQVQERTAQLQQSLDFEALLKRITDNVRDSLDEQQILQTAVEELAYGLHIEACDTGIYNAEQTMSTIAHELTHTLSSAQGKTFAIADAPHPEIYPYLLQGQLCQFCDVAPNTLRSEQQLLTVLACPIQDEQGVLGDIWLFKALGDIFNELEMRLVQQVANQCAIALRQSRLYQAAQAQVRELERLNQLKDDFLSTVSHELRTPMANIQMAVQILEVNLLTLKLLDNPNHPIQTSLDILHEEGQREINLINDLLNLSRLDADTEPLTLTPTDLRFWLPHIAEPFIPRAEQHQQTFEMDIPDPLPSITTDLFYLERSVTELLNNACKYTPAGETIRLSVQVYPTRLEISVSNSGVEIPEAERDRIFEKFYRIPNHDPWKYSGTGLGLALVQKMVHRLGGSITVKSVPHSTTFTLHLPYSMD